MAPQIGLSRNCSFLAAIRGSGLISEHLFDIASTYLIEADQAAWLAIQQCLVGVTARPVHFRGDVITVAATYARARKIPVERCWRRGSSSARRASARSVGG